MSNENDNEFPFDPNSLKRRLKQLEINQKFLLDAIDEIHHNLCPKGYGTWQMRVQQAVEAAREISKDRKNASKTTNKKTTGNG